MFLSPQARLWAKAFELAWGEHHSETNAEMFLCKQCELVAEAYVTLWE